LALLELGLLVLVAIVVLFIIGILILGFIVRSIVHWLPAVIVAALVLIYTQSLLWAAASFVAVAILMIAIKHR
jgi:hypothetical protein